MYSVCIVCVCSVVYKVWVRTSGCSEGGRVGRGSSFRGTRGIKWLYPALLQAMTIGEFNNPLVTHSSGG